MEQVRLIASIEELNSVIDMNGKVSFYGAGTRLNTFWGVVQEAKLNIEVSRVIVSRREGNADFFEGIPILALNETCIEANDVIILTVSEAYIDDIISKIRSVNDKADIYMLDYAFVDGYRVNKLAARIRPFISKFSGSCRTDANICSKRCVWSCWWQGVDNSPDIVKACFRNWQEKIPVGCELIIITEENYKNYIYIPEYILEKVQNGQMCMAHLSDYIRFALLAKYGGLWLDATVYLTDKIPEAIFDYKIYTRTFEGHDFGSKATWGIWFMASNQIGNPLFRFVKEAHEYYWKNYSDALYYLMTDYFIAIACNEYPEIYEMLKIIPANNILAMELGRHFNEPYDKDKYCEYTAGTFFQKLTWHGDSYRDDSFFYYLISREMDNGTECNINY